tara:strand:+ start:50 stop:349 length:300 start_codon:yes stop_codon:yes gene_type:complete
MLKLDDHLKYQVNHFHGSLFDFIYKCHEVLEHNKVINNFYEQACLVSKLAQKENLEQKVKDQMLAAIARRSIEMIDRHDMDLAEHLNMWLVHIEELNNL